MKVMVLYGAISICFCQGFSGVEWSGVECQVSHERKLCSISYPVFSLFFCTSVKRFSRPFLES